jgi:hypothetical protein
MTATQRRAWVWYAVAWLVVGVVYASMMTHSRPMFIGLSTSIAFLEGIGYVVPVAFLGVGVWYFTGWLAWPPRHAWRFVMDRRRHGRARGGADRRLLCRLCRARRRVRIRHHCGGLARGAYC